MASDRRTARRERRRNRLVEELGSAAFLPTVVGGGLVLLAGLVSWIGDGARADSVASTVAFLLRWAP